MSDSPPRRKPKKRRTRLNPEPFLVLALGANLFAGALYSPLTAVRRVRVEGAPPKDQGRIEGLLQQIRGVPCAQVHPRKVESETLRNPEIRTASLSRTPFGTAVLRIETRKAVARLDPKLPVGLTEDGVVYASTSDLDGLPVVVLPESVPQIGMTLGNGWRPVDVAHLATLVHGLETAKAAKIVLDRGGRVCLNMLGGIVDLGSFDGLDAKVARLREILAQRPDLFATVATLHLVDVDAPTYTPRPANPKKP